MALLRSIPGRRLAPWLMAALLVALTGCGTEDDLIGAGPVRSIEPGPDGTAYVLRAWRERTPNAAVLLSVDPATGAAAPILAKLPGRRGATIREIELAVPRPADTSTDPELLISGPEIGLAIIRGPFAYLGAMPVIESLTEERLLPPALGPAAAPSPDGTHLLLFALEGARPDPDAPAAWIPTVVDLRSLEITTAATAQPDRRARWTGPGQARLGDAVEMLIADDGSVSTRVAAETPPPAPAHSVAPARLHLERAEAEPITVSLPAPADGFTRWPDATPGSPALLGLLWTDALITRVETGPEGAPRLVPLPLVFDRQRGRTTPPRPNRTTS